MVDLIHPRVRNTILRDIPVRARYVEHEAQAVAIEIADAAEHDVSAWPRWHPYITDSLSPRRSHLWPPELACVGWIVTQLLGRASILSMATLLYRRIIFPTAPKGSRSLCGIAATHSHFGKSPPGWGYGLLAPVDSSLQGRQQKERKCLARRGCAGFLEVRSSARWHRGDGDSEVRGD